MRVLIFALLIFSKPVIINCSMIDNMSVKFSEFTGLISKTFNDVGDKVKRLFAQLSEEETKNEEKGKGRLFVDRPVTHDMKLAFNDFIKLQGQEGENNIIETNKISDGADPALLLETPQLARWHGRDMETHIIQTKDEYFLTVHRITVTPYMQANRTVLLHHGLLGSSTDWILLGPAKSLPYMLSDAGYDVWITNARGNYYSRGHLSKQIGRLDYWKFSWQEMGELDLPAVINYIREMKNCNESINFIGHSMGATALLVLLSSMPKYNEYLRVGILLAPLAYMNNVKGPIKVMTGISEEVIKLLGVGEFLPSRKVPSWLSTKYCKGPKIFCSNPLLFLTGFHQKQNWNTSFVARLLYHVPAGGSTNTLLHYMQVAHSGKFHRFDEPNAEFLLNSITLPIALISSNDDWLASIPNVLKLYFSLSNPIDHYIIRDKNIIHTDFVWGDDANILVFARVIKYLEKGLTWNVETQNEVV